MDDFRIVSVCDTVEENARSFVDEVTKFQSQPPNIPHVEEMLAHESLDGVDICVPHGLHHSVAIACLEAGANVLVEKPVGVTIKATKAIQVAADKAGKFAATAENCRRYLGQRAVHWAINTEKLIGDPRSFFALQVGAGRGGRSTGEVLPWRWRSDRFLGGGGMVIMDSGFHWVDTIRYFFGEVDTVYAQVKQFEPKMLQHPDKGLVQDRREDMWTAIMTFKNGVVGTWAWTTAAPGARQSLITFRGSDGSIEGPPGESVSPVCLFE